jgi:hypothetical protein
MMHGGAKRRRAGAPPEDVTLHLRHIRSAVIVAIAALRRQNCELDEDIARLLQRCVCDRIDDQIEKLEAKRAVPRVAVRRGSERGRATGHPWPRGARPGRRRRALAS